MTMLLPPRSTKPRPKVNRFMSMSLEPYQREGFDPALIQPAALTASGAGGGEWESHLCFEGVETGDGREIAPGALTLRPGPSLPMMGLEQRTMGHMLAKVCGGIQDVERRDDGTVYGGGRWLGSETGQTFEGLVTPDENGISGLHWVSVDLEIFNYEYVVKGYDEDGWEEYLLRITKANLMGATCLPFPAFSRAYIAPKDGRTLSSMVEMGAEDRELGGSSNPYTGPLVIAASAAPTGAPPAEFFTDPGFTGVTHHRVYEPDENGWQRFAGHLADWTVPHIGVGNGSIYAPHSAADYAYFATGTTRADDPGAGGAYLDFRTGVISLGGGHADVSLGYRGASQHYDDVCSAVADVAVGEDAFGPWVSGVIRPGTTAEQIRVLMASDISGDWRRIGGNMELVGILAVNVAGFPVRDSLAASGVVDFRAAFTASAGNEEGEMTALVAAGMIRQDPQAMEMQQMKRRIAALEAALDPFRPLAMEYLAGRIGA